MKVMLRTTTKIRKMCVSSKMKYTGFLNAFFAIVHTSLALTSFIVYYSVISNVLQKFVSYFYSYFDSPCRNIFQYVLRTTGTKENRCALPVDLHII
jgi:hypothetical protein